MLPDVVGDAADVVAYIANSDTLADGVVYVAISFVVAGIVVVVDANAALVAATASQLAR